MTIARSVRRLWVRGLQKGTLYANRYGRFDTLYHVSDPWEMASESEQRRFHQTNKIIETEFGGVGTLLEIGCGEGHQSQHLSRMCGQLYGFDVSPLAVGRAKARCPTARLSVADIFSFQSPLPKFDLVVACEVLYYVKDVPAALKRMGELGSRCLVTYLQAGPCVLDRHVDAIPTLKTRIIRSADTAWKAAWWRS